MSGLRRKTLVAVGVLAVGVGAWGSTGTSADDRHEDRWWKPPSDVRRMLDQVDARSLERYDRALVGFGTRHTLSVQDDPRRGIGAARDYIKAQFDQIAATSGGRMTVELQSYIQEPASRIPVPTRITNVVATLRGTDPASADRVYVVGAHYDSRVTDVLNATSDAPGANDDGSGHHRRARAGARDGPASDRGHDRLRRLRRRGAGPVRLQPLRRARAGRRLEHPGRPEHGHHRQPGRRQRRPRPAHDPAVLRGRPDERDARSRPRGGSRSAARTTASRASSRATSRRPARTAPPACASSSSGGATASCAAATRSRSSQRGWPAVRFSEPIENFDHQHQDVRVENGKQFGDLLEFVDFRYLARVTRVVGSSLAALARVAAGAGQRARDHGRSCRTTPSCAGTRTPSPTSSATRSSGATRPSRSGRTARRVGNVTTRTIEGPQQGRLPGRRPRDRPRRQPQPGRVPDPRESVAGSRRVPPTWRHPQPTSEERRLQRQPGRVRLPDVDAERPVHTGGGLADRAPVRGGHRLHRVPVLCQRGSDGPSRAHDRPRVPAARGTGYEHERLRAGRLPGGHRREHRADAARHLPVRAEATWTLARSRSLITGPQGGPTRARAARASGADRPGSTRDRSGSGSEPESNRLGGRPRPPSEGGPASARAAAAQTSSASFPTTRR